MESGESERENRSGTKKDCWPLVSNLAKLELVFWLFSSNIRQTYFLLLAWPKLRGEWTRARFVWMSIANKTCPFPVFCASRLQQQTSKGRRIEEKAFIVWNWKASLSSSKPKHWTLVSDCFVCGINREKLLIKAMIDYWCKNWTAKLGRQFKINNLFRI